MYAAYVGHDTVVNLLLDSHADPNKGTPFGLTPLMVAAGCGNESVCYFLIQVSLQTSLCHLGSPFLPPSLPLPFLFHSLSLFPFILKITDLQFFTEWSND